MRFSAGLLCLTDRRFDFSECLFEGMSHAYEQDIQWNPISIFIKVSLRRHQTVFRNTSVRAAKKKSIDYDILEIVSEYENIVRQAHPGSSEKNREGERNGRALIVSGVAGDEFYPAIHQHTHRINGRCPIEVFTWTQQSVRFC